MTSHSTLSLEGSIIPFTASIGLLVVILYRYLLFPVFFSPLAKIPSAHWSARFSSIWILNKRRQEQETPTVHAAHERLGPIILLAPDQISVNSVDEGIRTIYAGGYEKGTWYLNVFNNYGIMPMFSMPSRDAHAKRRRMLSNIYAKSSLHGSLPLSKITNTLLADRLVPKLRKLASHGEAIEFYYIFCASTLDIVSAYVFGLKNGSDFIRNPSSGSKFFRNYKARQRYQFWPQECPSILNFLKRLDLKWLLVPAWVDKANNELEGWMLNAADAASQDVDALDLDGTKLLDENHPSVYAQLRKSLLQEASKQDLDLPISDIVDRQRLTIASELLDHTLAGFDTSSITLTFLAWELSRPQNAKFQDRLRNELLSVPQTDRLDSKTLDNLPVLHAILMETLRLHAAIPGNQPRVTPPSARLCGISGIPANVRVQSQAWSLHRNPEVFPDPLTWNPDRWLESSPEQKQEMLRWFWAFGSGGRMCVGSNLAIYDMKAIISAVWTKFKTSVAYDEGMVHNGGYVAEPVGKDGKVLLLNVEEIEG